jgi:hypothetical protein
MNLMNFVRLAIAIGGLALMFAPRTIGAGNPPLPQGLGLAARYPGDVGIASDPAVILADDFESYGSPNELSSKWNQVFNSANMRLSTEPGNVFSGSKALEFTIPQTNSEAGPAVARFLNPERDVLFWRAYGKYGDAFDVIGSAHSGMSISAHYCCPGVPADGFNKFSVGYEPARFDTSVPAPGRLAVYIYHPLQRDLYGDHFLPTGLVSPNTSLPFDFGPDFVSRPDVVPVRGRWYAYELMVQANTPGERDGRIAMWLDGNLIADFTNLRLRDTSSLKIDKFSLEMYVFRNNLAVAQKWYDNAVAATSYIGPMVTANSLPSAPTNLRIVPGSTEE